MFDRFNLTAATDTALRTAFDRACADHTKQGSVRLSSAQLADRILAEASRRGVSL